MNRKGFTLIEVLAVIIVLSIILVIAAPSISNIYKNSKLKSEQVFINRLSTVIDSYVKLNTDKIGFTKVREANKKQENYEYSVDIYSGKINDNQITFENIINDNLLSAENYVNAGNKDYINPVTNEKGCITNAQIEVYRDSDFVYCHKVKKDSLGCLTDEYKDSIIGEYVIDTCIWE